MRKITKIRRSIRAISPVISVLLMIAIAVVASLVAYAWVMGYMNFQTSKAGNAIQIPSFAAGSDADPDDTDRLRVYVQNVGEGTVKVGTVYVNDIGVGILSPADLSIGKGATLELLLDLNSPWAAGQTLKVKVVTTDGTFMEMTGKIPSAQQQQTTEYTLTISVVGTGCSVTKNPNKSTYALGEIVALTAVEASGWSFDHWGGDASGTSLTTSITIDTNPFVTATFTEDSQPPQQFTLTVNSARGTPGGGGSYASGSTAYATVTPLTVLDGSNPDNVRYVFTQWSGDASGTTSPSNPITMNADKTATANWKTQYRLQFTADPVEGGTPTATNWFDAGATNVPISTTVTGGYTFDGWTASPAGCVTFADASSASTTINVINAGIVTAHFIPPVQTYQVTFGNTGLGGDATGNLVSFTVTGGSYSGATSPISVAGGSIMVDAGATVSYTFVDEVESSVDGKQYKFTTVTGPASGFTVTADTTVTGNYKTQYQVTFSVGNMGGDTAAGPVLTVGTDTYTYAQLPQTGIWVDSGTTYSYNATVSAGTGKRYVLTGTSGLATPIVAAGTATPTYKIQYEVELAVNPSGAGTTTPAIGTNWQDAGTLAISATATGDYIFNSWTATGSITIDSPTSATINGPGTITANFIEPLFYDDFTDGFDPLWYTENGPYIRNSNPAPGTSGGNYAVLDGSSSDDAMTVTIDATGYGSISLSYWRSVIGFESGDHLYVQWRVGTSGSWITIEDITANIAWTQNTFNFPVTANDNVIQIRFSITANSDEYGYVDDVLVTGIPLPPRTTLFSDDFESDWQSEWTPSAADIQTSQYHSSNHAARLYVSGSTQGSITLQISTTGYTSIKLNYWRLFDRTGTSADNLIIEWRVGSSPTWTNLETLTSDMTSWGQSSTFNLNGADNQATIQIRFRLQDCESGTGGPDYGYIDDVIITGRA